MLPKRTGYEHLTSKQIESTTAMIKLLNNGAVIHGPGSDDYDSYFYRENDSYIYAIIPEYGDDSLNTFHDFPATRAGFLHMLRYACFNNHSYSFQEVTWTRTRTP